MPASFTHWWVRPVSSILRLCSPGSPRAANTRWQTKRAALTTASPNWQAAAVVCPVLRSRTIRVGTGAATSQDDVGSSDAYLVVPRVHRPRAAGVQLSNQSSLALV